MFNQTDTMKASLQRQKDLYLQHSRIVERTQTTLSYQHKIQSHNTIPKKHRPRPPVIVDSALNKTHAEKISKGVQQAFSTITARSNHPEHNNPGIRKSPMSGYTTIHGKDASVSTRTSRFTIKMVQEVSPRYQSDRPHHVSRIKEKIRSCTCAHLSQEHPTSTRRKTTSQTQGNQCHISIGQTAQD